MTTAPERPNLYETLPRLLADAALAGVDIGDLFGYVCTEAARLLPVGENLSMNRTGSWEATHIDGLTAPDATESGTVAGPMDVECQKCYSPAGQPCTHMTHYYDLKHPHPERTETARTAAYYEGAWW